VFIDMVGSNPTFFSLPNEWKSRRTDSENNNPTWPGVAECCPPSLAEIRTIQVQYCPLASNPLQCPYHPTRLFWRGVQREPALILGLLCKSPNLADNLFCTCTCPVATSTLAPAYLQLLRIRTRAGSLPPFLHRAGFSAVFGGAAYVLAAGDTRNGSGIATGA
jgi:hypothetical protein